MKSASQWAIQEKRVDYIPTEGDLEHFAKKVQADTLRHVVEIIRNTGSGSQRWMANQFEEEADKLEA